MFAKEMLSKAGNVVATSSNSVGLLDGRYNHALRGKELLYLLDAEECLGLKNFCTVEDSLLVVCDPGLWLCLCEEQEPEDTHKEIVNTLRNRWS
jgi:hypothetical protein